MRFGNKARVAAGLASLVLLATATAGCASKAEPQDGMVARIEAAASKAEAAANKAEAAAKQAADAAARAQAAADKAEQMFHHKMRK